MPEQLGEGSDFTEMKNKLSDAYGVDAQKIEDAVFDIMLNNIIIGCLVDENPNAVQLKTDFNANIDKIVAQLNGSTDADIVTTLNLTDEKVAMMKQSGATIIDDFTQSDKLGQLGGTIINAMRTGGDMMTALKETGIIDSFTIIFDDMKNPTPAMGAKLSPMEETTPPATETGTMEDELRALLHDNIPKDTISTIALSLRIVGILYAISILAFGILLLMTLIRTLFAKNKGVKMGVAIWLGGYWGILLVIIPLIAFLVLQAVGAFGGALAMMKFSFMSSSIVATACTFTMFVLWFLYGRQRKRMKAIAMADKYGYETSYEDAKQNGHV